MHKRMWWALLEFHQRRAKYLLLPTREMVQPKHESRKWERMPKPF